MPFQGCYHLLLRGVISVDQGRCPIAEGMATIGVNDLFEVIRKAVVLLLVHNQAKGHQPVYVTMPKTDKFIFKEWDLLLSVSKSFGSQVRFFSRRRRSVQAATGEHRLAPAMGIDQASLIRLGPAVDLFRVKYIP